MRYEYNRVITNELLSEKLFEEYIPSSFSLDTPENKENCILLLTVMCGFVSKEEIVLLTGMSYRYCEKIIHTLIKKEFLIPLPLNLSNRGYVSRTNKLYTFTKTGYDFTSDLDGGRKIFNLYHKKKANPKNVHDYLNGMNLFGCLIGLQGKEFDWIRERVYGNYMRNNKTLAVDSEVSMLGFTLHIEEDIGTESDTVLLDKLFLYQKYPENSSPILSSDRHALLISYYAPAFLTSAAFHQRSINALSEYAKDHDKNELLEDVFAGADISKEMNDTLNSLYVITGKQGGRRSSLKISDLEDMSGKYSAENPFYQNAFRKFQYEKFTAKRNKLFAALWSMPEYKDIRYTLYDGFPLYIAPTLLLERYVKYICDFSSCFEKLSRCLKAYFGQISFQDYSSRKAIDGNIVLRNRFSAESGSVYVEFPTIDLGALMRIRRFLEESDQLSSANHLILIVDYAEEVLEISKWIKDFRRKRDQPIGFLFHNTYAGVYLNKSKNDIYYLRCEDLEAGRPERLFYAHGYRELIDNNGNTIGTGENKICYLFSEHNPNYKTEGF